MNNIYEKRGYIAKVTNNEDPDKLGRIKVVCEQLTGDEDEELPSWIEHELDWGWFYVPDIDELVVIEVLTKTPRDTIENQSSIVEPVIRWTGKRYYGGDDTDSPRPIPDEFKENYKRRGFSTPSGHMFLFDDTPGSEVVSLRWKNEDEQINLLIFDSDGSVKIQIDEGATLHLTGKDSSTVSVFGDGAVKVAIADHLETFYNSLKTKFDLFDAHVHATGTGPSGVPVPTISASSWDASINSTKMTIPDG